MKKSIIIAAMAVAVITLGIITACSKETPTTNERNAPAVKSAPDLALQSLLRTVWHRTDSVFQANPALLLDIAAEENLDEFYKLTGISTEQIHAITVLASARIGNDGGNAPETPGCSDCDKRALSNYVDKCITLRAILNEIHEYEPQFVDSTIIMIPERILQCERNCWLTYVRIFFHPEKYILCIEDCHMTHAIEDAESYLADMKHKDNLGII